MTASINNVALVNSMWTRLEKLYSNWAHRRGVSWLEDSVLYALRVLGLTSQKDIAESFGLPKQSVSSTVASLVEQGHARMQQDPKDGRAKHVTLTEQGVRYADDLVGPTVRCESNAVARLGSSDAEQLALLLNRFYEALKTEMDAYVETRPADTDPHDRLSR